MKEVIINRKKWLRGGLDGNARISPSNLRNENGHMCCLGFIGLAEGACPSKMEHCGTPANYMKECGFNSSNNPVCQKMMEANDRAFITDKEREEILVSLAANAGYKLEFEG